MANPQLENGYLKIANELHHALIRIRLPVYDRSILDAIIYKTYGWNKKTDHISYTQFQRLTGIQDSRHIARSLKKLRENKIIVVSKNGNKTPTYGIQKDYEKWIVSTPVEATPVEATPVEATPVEIHTIACRGVLSTPVEVMVSTPVEAITKDNTIHILNTLTKDSEVDEMQFDEKLAKITDLYTKNISVHLTPIIADDLKDITETYPIEWCEESIKIAARNNAHSLTYIKRILENWHTKGFIASDKPVELVKKKTVEDYYPKLTGRGHLDDKPTATR